MLRRDMSSSPPLGDPLPKINKFVGESFELNSNVRTIFAGALEDSLNRDSRVILLIGPSGSGKTSLIDFLCNHFYGATLEGGDRYHIANEKFGSNTPDKSIITYVFNNTIMDFRPIIIDTPGTGQHRESEDLSRLLYTWVQGNSRLRIDLIGVVFSNTVRMTTEEENELQKTLDLFPGHLRSNFSVFITGSDGSPKPDVLLRRFNLHESKTFKVNTSCLYQKRQGDALQEHLRGTYWRMTTGNFTELFFHLRSLNPMTFSGQEPELPPMGNVNRWSSGSSTVSTVVHREPTISKTEEVITRTFGHDGKVSTTTSRTTTDNGRTTEETTVVHPPVPTFGLGKRNLPPPPPPPIPPPPLPTSEPPKSAGLPTGLLEDIRNLRRADSSEDDVIVVEYDLPAQPEIVVMKKTPTPPKSISSSQQSSPPRLEELPPPLTPTTNRPYDMPPSEFYKSVTVDERGTTTRFSSLGTRVSVHSGLGKYDTVPPRSDRAVSPAAVSTTYSTVAFMNEDGRKTPDKLKAFISVKENLAPRGGYNPYEREESKTPETPSTVVLRTTPIAPLSQQMRHSYNPPETTTRPLYEPYDSLFTRTQSTRYPQEGDVTRYVYDTGTRSHLGYSVPGRSSRSSVRGSTNSITVKRESKSLETVSRQVMTEQPYYEASGYTITKSPHRSATSLHALNFPEHTGPELVHSEDNYAYIDPLTKKPKTPVAQPIGTGTSPTKSPRRETMIDFPLPDTASPFQRNDGTRKSVRSPDVTSPGGPVPARRTSAPRNSGDRRSGVYPPPANIDNRNSPEYSIGGGVILRDQPGRNTHPPRDLVSRELREREDYLRQTNTEVHRQSYPQPPNRIYENVHPPLRYENIPGQGAQPRQSQIGQGATPGSPNRNDFIIPQQMRENQGPIQVTVGMTQKNTPTSPAQQTGTIGHGTSPLRQSNHNHPPPKYEPPPHLPPHGYQDRDYGDNWDGETTIMTTTQQQTTRRREEGRVQGQRPDDLQIGEGVTVTSTRVTQQNDPRSPPPPAYPSRQYPTTPTDKGRRGGGDDSDLETGIIQEERTLVQGGSRSGRRGGEYGYSSGQYTKKGGLKTTTTTTTTTTSKGKRKGKASAPAKKKTSSGFAFKPCSCATPRDCFLNTLFFIIAPIFILAVIITIIVISVTAGKNHRNDNWN